MARIRAEILESRQLLSTANPVTVSPAASIVASPLGGYNGGSSGLNAGITITSPIPGSTTPSAILNAYGGTNLTSSSGKPLNGSGQTIAIIDAYNDPNIVSDLKTFDAQYGLTNLSTTPGQSPSLKVVNQTGGSSLPSTNASWTLETSLDVEWAHAIAPDANILLVEANSASISDLMTAVNTARNTSGVSVVSMSWGTPELFLGSSLESQYNSYFTTPTSSSNGITFIASSGDDGGLFGPSWPAVSPNVVAVGGTTLPLSSTGVQTGPETAWFDSSGGISFFQPEPSYQTGVQSTGARTTPDVAYSANPNFGFAVYDSTTVTGVSGWSQVGGTSAGSPQWAALVALADQARVSQGQTTLNGATQTLPALYQAGTSAFHQITSGFNFYFGAGAGYNAVTGLGSPVDSSIVSTLASFGVKSAAAPAASTVTAAPTVSHATTKPADLTEIIVVTSPGTPTGSSGGQVVAVIPVGGHSGSGSSSGSAPTTLVIVIANPFFSNQTSVQATAPVVFNQGLLSTSPAQQSALPPVAQPLLSAGRQFEPHSSAGSSILGEAPSESPETAPPLYDLPDPNMEGEANPVIARIPTTIWDAAIDVLYGETQEVAVPIVLADDLHPMPSFPVDAEPSLGTSLLAGAAATFWMVRTARRDKDGKRRLFSLPN